MVRCFLTTFDNPYDPYDHYEDWYRFDCDKGYNCCGMLARFAYSSDQLTDNENAFEIEQAIDMIIKNDPLNIYKKVKKTIPDDKTDPDESETQE